MSATQAAPGTFEAVKAAIRHFEATQAKYREYGANDTEPDAIFQGILWKSLNDEEDAVIPGSADGWELYSHSMDCKEAADALQLAAVGAVQALFDCRMSDSKRVQKYLEDYCWRYS